jgi:hypothetical protein
MTKTRRQHYRQLAAFYAVVFATGFLWHPRSLPGTILVCVVILGVAPWVVLSQPDRIDV